MLRFQVDTGFNAVLIYGGKVRASAVLQSDSHEAALGLVLRAQLAEIREFQIGGWKTKGFPAYVTDEIPGGEPGFDGLLGPKALGVRRLAFDFERHILAWE